MQLQHRIAERLPLKYREPGHLPFNIRNWLSRLVALLAFIIFAYYAYQVQPIVPGNIFDYEHLAAQVPLVWYGVLLVALAVLLAYPQAIIPWQPSTAPLSRRVNFLAGVGGLACMVVFLEAQIKQLGYERAHTLLPDEQLAVLVAGVLLLAYGLGGGGLPWRAGRFLRRLKRDDWAEFAVVLLITALAYGVRAWQIGSAVHIFVDELNFATGAATFWVERHVPLAMPGVRSFPFMFPYLQNHFITLLGRDLPGMRALSVIMGTLTIPAVYMLARALFDRPTAIAAALFLATFPPHVQFSRLGLNNIADPMFGAYALAFLARGFKHNRRIDFVLGGVALGLTQYWYELGRTIFPLMVALWSGWGLVTGYAWGRLKGLFWAALAALIVAAPIYATIYVNDLPLNARVQTVGDTDSAFSLLDNVEDTEQYRERLLLAFMMFVHQPEWGTYYYGGHAGFVLVGFVPFLLLGAGYVLARGTSPGIVLVAFIVVNAFFTSLIFSTQLSARYVVSFPAVAVLLGLGVRVLYGLLMSPPVARRYAGVLLGLVVMTAGISAGTQTYYFFEEHLPIFNNQFRGNHPFDTQDAVYRIRDYDPEVQGHIVAYDPINAGFLNGLLGFFRSNPEASGVQTQMPGIFKPWELEGERPYLFFLMPADSTTRRLIDWYFPLAEPQTTPYNVPDGYQLLLFEAGPRVQGPHAPFELVAATAVRNYYILPLHERAMVCYQDDPNFLPLRRCIDFYGRR